MKTPSLLKITIKEIKRICLSRRFIVSLLLSMTILLNENYIHVFEKYILKSNSIWTLQSALVFSLSFGSIPYAIVIFTCFATSLTYCEDTAFNYDWYVRTRTNNRNYALSKIFGTSFSGGLFAFLVIVLSSGILSCFFPSAIATDKIDTAFAAALRPFLYDLNGWLYILIVGLLFWSYGAIWGLTGLTISIFNPNKYIVTIAPFMICIMLESISSLMGFTFFRPFEQILIYPESINSIRIIILTSVTVLILLSLFFILGFKKKKGI